MAYDVVPRHRTWEPNGLPCTIHLHDVVATSSRHTKTGMQDPRPPLALGCRAVLAGAVLAADGPGRRTPGPRRPDVLRD